MKWFLLVVLLILGSFLFGKDILLKSNPRTYQINVQTVVQHLGSGQTRLDLFLAFLGSNEYQTLYQMNADSLAEIATFGSAGDSCIYYELSLGKKQILGKKAILKNEFILEVNDVSIDFDAIDSIFPYDMNDPNYLAYTGSTLPFINVNHNELLLVSDSLWTISSDILNYAKNCFEYVAASFEFGLPLVGFKSLDFILENKMGDCGNLSSVFITLLRMKNIPARHLIAFRPDASLHVWADFYLANYGWIPADITYRKEFPNNNYFGNIEFVNSGFIVQRGIGHQVSVLDNPMRISGLQTYSYQVSLSDENTSMKIQRTVTCQLK